MAVKPALKGEKTKELDFIQAPLFFNYFLEIYPKRPFCSFDGPAVKKR